VNAAIDWLASSGAAQGLTLWALASLVGGIVFGKIARAREAHANIEKGD